MLNIDDASGFRRTVAGTCLILGPLVALIGGLVTPWEESDTTAAYLQALGENSGQAQVSAVLLYFGYLLFVPGIFGIMHLLRRRAIVLGHVAGILAVWGWVTLPGLLVTDFYDLSLAEHADRQAAIAISDRAGEYVGGTILGIPVLLGFIGLVLLSVALWRARFAPVWIPVVLLAGFVVAFASPPGALYFAVAFGLVLVALGYVGLKILRLSDGEWERGVTTSATKSPRVARE